MVVVIMMTNLSMMMMVIMVTMMITMTKTMTLMMVIMKDRLQSTDPSYVFKFW